jgi:hypothetical protein
MHRPQSVLTSAPDRNRHSDEESRAAVGKRNARWLNLNFRGSSAKHHHDTSCDNFEASTGFARDLE